MRKIILFIILIFSISISSYSQCREYIKAIAPGILSPYILDGNFNAPVVYEGEKVDLSRTFLGGTKYKIAVLGMELFDKKITVTDEDGFILFKNYIIKNDEEAQYYTNIEGNKIPCLGSTEWEFELKKSQNLTISIVLEQKSKKKKNRLRGCLGIVVGFGE